MNAETKKTPAKETLPPEVAEAVLDLINFIWKHHFENAEENWSDPVMDRVFRSRLRVENWLFGHDTQPEEGW